MNHFRKRRDRYYVCDILWLSGNWADGEDQMTYQQAVAYAKRMKNANASIKMVVINRVDVLETPIFKVVDAD